MIFKTIIIFVVTYLTALPLYADTQLTITDLIKLSGHPEYDRQTFEVELFRVFGNFDDIKRYGADDLPNDLEDSLYWLTAATGSVVIEENLWSPIMACGRIGRDGYAYVVNRYKPIDLFAPIVPIVKTSESDVQSEGAYENEVFWAWGKPFDIFPDDAIARLDCSVMGSVNDKAIL